MLHGECAKGQALMEAYLEAINRREPVLLAPLSMPYARDVKVAQDMVRECRGFTETML